MRWRRAAFAAMFAVALVATYVPRFGAWETKAVLVMLVLGVSLAGGFLIGHWWAVWFALATNLVVSALIVADGALLWIGIDMDRLILILVGQVLVSTLTTALGVWLRAKGSPRLGAAPTSF